MVNCEKLDELYICGQKILDRLSGNIEDLNHENENIERNFKDVKKDIEALYKKVVEE